MSEQIYYNGTILDAEDALVSAFNPSLLHGVGLFETLRTYDGRPLRLLHHIERMQRSAEALRLPIAEAVPLIEPAVRQVIDANHRPDARLRITVTPPASATGETRPTLIVSAQPLNAYPPELYEQGMTVYVCTDYRQSAQDPLAGHKTTSYFPRLIALRQAQEKKCGEALWFTPQNMLAEGSMSNIFLVKGGRLHTPPLDTPVLPGVTRGTSISAICRSPTLLITAFFIFIPPRKNSFLSRKGC